MLVICALFGKRNRAILPFSDDSGCDKLLFLFVRYLRKHASIGKPDLVAFVQLGLCDASAFEVPDRILCVTCAELCRSVKPFVVILRDVVQGNEG